MISDDAGATFRLAKFNGPGTPEATLVPVTEPGHLTECGATRSGSTFSVNVWLAIHGAAKSLPSRRRLPRYVQASRLTPQPAFAARNGLLYLAWNNSSSPRYGDLASRSNILFVRSGNDGNTWSAPTLVNPLLAADVQQGMHVDQDPNEVQISYFTQHAN